LKASDNETLAVPKLNVVAVNQPLGLGDGFAIVPANHHLIVVPDGISRMVKVSPLSTSGKSLTSLSKGCARENRREHQAV
jgi:hypothetical protein